MISEINQSQKEENFIDTESRMVEAGGKGVGSQCLMGSEFQFRKMRKL